MSVDLVPISSFVSVSIPGKDGTKISIKKFVESKKLKFEKGSGFYELSKPETIQLNKEILVQRLSDPKTLIKGKTLRKVLKIDESKSKNGKFMVDEDLLKEFRVFVQSTSYNRNLIGGTTFLYKKDGVDLTSLPKKPVEDEDAPAAKRPKRGAGAASVATAAAVPPHPSGGGARPTGAVEIVFSFDTTGSMYPCLSTVRSVIRDTLKRLTEKIPSIRIGILAHGDYCDKNSSYVTSAANNYKLCSSAQVNMLVDFVTNVGSTFGGDFPECYELVLREVATKFDWSAGANKSLVLIGDAPPHGVNDNPGKIDWRKEAKDLKDKGIRVYAVQALDYSESTSFYREVAQITMGFHLRLHQFASITDFLTAVCYHEGDNADSSMDIEGGRLDLLERELTSSGRMVTNLRQLFDRLRGSAADDDTTAPVANADGLTPVSPSRFQVLTVDQDKPIKQFAEERGLIFKVGRGFYEFTKPESISDKKEVILMDKTTGDFYTGWAAAREYAGIDPGLAKKQQPTESDKYVVFVQSSSYNRKLIAGQRFLYEVDRDR